LPFIIFSLGLLAVITGCSKAPVATLTVTPVASTPAPQTPTATLPAPATSTIPSPSLTTPADAAPLIERATQAVSNLKTYHLDRSIKVVRSVKSDKSDQTTTSTLSNGDLDRSLRQMRMDNKVAIKAPVGQPVWPLSENQVYIINDPAAGHQIYMQGLFPSKPQLWNKTAISDEVWQMQDQAQDLLRILKLTPVQVLPAETVVSGNNNLPCNVLQVSPSLAEFWTLIANQPGIEIPTNAPAGVSYSQFVKTADMKLWLAQTTNLPVKAELVMNFVIGPALAPSLTNTISMDIHIVMLFSEYDKALAIQLPPEAQSAEELKLKDP
jgi:hypothetical protein